MKLKISYTAHPDTVVAEQKCSSCSGSGYYDSWDVKRNRPIKCQSCYGTGKEHPTVDEIISLNPHLSWMRD